jgi:hypothetical protein
MQAMGGGQVYPRTHSWEEGYRTGSTNSSSESAAIKTQRISETNASTPIAVKSGGPIDLDDSPSPTKQVHPITFGSFDGDDEIQTFDDLYDDYYGPDQAAV